MPVTDEIVPTVDTIGEMSPDDVAGPASKRTVSDDIVPNAYPKPETFFGGLKKAAVGAVTAVGKGAKLPTMSDADLGGLLLEEQAKSSRTSPTTAGKVGEIAGGIVGGVGTFAGAEAAGTAVASETGPAAPIIGLGTAAAAFGSAGAYESFVSAGIRALSEGKSLADAVTIGKKVAKVGAAAGAATAIALPGTVSGAFTKAAAIKAAMPLAPATADALAATVTRTAVGGAAVGAGAQLAQNVAEKQAGLKTDPLEGLVEQAVIMGGLPVLLHARALYRESKTKTEAGDTAGADAAKKGADAIAQTELEKVDTTKPAANLSEKQFQDAVKAWQDQQKAKPVPEAKPEPKPDLTKERQVVREADQHIARGKMIADAVDKAKKDGDPPEEIARLEEALARWKGETAADPEFVKAARRMIGEPEPEQPKPAEESPQVDAGMEAAKAKAAEADKQIQAQQESSAKSKADEEADIAKAEAEVKRTPSRSAQTFKGPEGRQSVSEVGVQMPATPPEPEKGMTVIQEIKAKGARTIAQIQALYPKSALSREDARKLRDQAWGGPPPPEPPKPRPPEEPPDDGGAGATVDLPPKPPVQPGGEETAEPKGEPNALESEATPPVRPVRDQPEQSASEVPTEGSRPKDDEGGGETPASSREGEITIAGKWKESDLTKQSIAKMTMGERADLARYFHLRDKEGLLEVGPSRLASHAKKRIGEIKAERAKAKPETIVSAAYRTDEGNVETGANHPEILERLGVKGFEEKESRNTPDFGFVTDRGRFVTREEAGPISKASGQNLEDFEPGHPVHSNEVASPVEPDKPLSEVPQTATKPDHAVAESTAREIGFTFKPNDAPGVSTEGMPPEMVAEIRKKHPPQWEFTDRRTDSSTSGLTFYMPEGSSREDIIKRFEEKKAESEKQPETKPAETAKPVTPAETAAETSEKPTQPEKVADKAQEVITETVKTDGVETAKEAKSELVQAIEDQIKSLPEPMEERVGKYATYVGRKTANISVADKDGAKAVGEVSGKSNSWTFKHDKFTFNAGSKEEAERFGYDYLEALARGQPWPPPKVTIEIPGDGTFTINKTPRALGELLRRAEAIETSTKQKKVFEESKPTKAEGQAALQEAEVPKGELKAKADALAEKLDKLKIQSPGGGHMSLFGVIPDTWNRAVEIAQAAIRAGGSIADAIDRAIQFIRDNFKGKWDEQAARDYFEKAPIEQFTEEIKEIRGKKSPLAEQIQESFDAGEKLAVAKDAAGRALNGLKAVGAYIKEKFNGAENIDELLSAKGDLSAAMQTRGWMTRKWVKAALKSAPRARDQAAIRKWVDAGGDMAELRRGMNETKPQYRQAYQDAMNLSPDLLKVAQEARRYFEQKLDEAIDAGVLKEGVEDYIHRMYEFRPNARDKALAYVQTGILSSNPALAKKRVFGADWEAEKAGFKPVQSFIPAIAHYETSLNKAIAARQFIARATELKAPDGRPVIDIKGVGIPLTNKETGERIGTLIKPKFNPSKSNEPGTSNYRGDYVNKEFPALSRWKWAATDSDGKPIFVQGDVAIHPDFVPRFTSMLEPSRVKYGRYGAVLRPALAVSSLFKQTMLDLSGFHMVQIAVHGLEHKVNPFNLVKDIDFNDRNVDGLLKGGVTLGGDYHYSGEGLAGNSLTRQVPILGPVMESYHNWLFQDFIPKMKITMALKALERNRKRYAGTMTEEQIFSKTASQANSAFGELNYTLLERSQTARDLSRLILLAPDFLEARSRFAAEALSKGGKNFGNEQRTALLLGALTMYTAARVLNKLTDDQYHWEPENAFSWVHKGQAYGLRTVQGDILHAVENFQSFALHRLNPVFTRPALEAITGRDEFGRKRSLTETLADSVSNIIPISLRSGKERSLAESFFNSFGVTDRRWQDTDSAFKMAKAWKEKHNIGAPGEFVYDPDKDTLRNLKIALSRGDDESAAKEIQSLVSEKKRSLSQLDTYFDRYSKMPFTGSKANDRRWEATLTDDQKKTVEAATQHKQALEKLYRKARGQFMQARVNNNS